MTHETGAAHRMDSLNLQLDFIMMISLCLI
jgi:hypothetical protein